jgi:phosphatidylglycerophosphate synthase
VPSGNTETINQAPQRDRSKAGLLPAVILVRPESAGLKIAALTLLDRLIVAIHRGGAGEIMVVSKTPLPLLTRTEALGINFKLCCETPAIEGPVLVALSDILVQPADVRSCLQGRHRLVTRRGEELGIGVVDSLNSHLEAAPGARPAGVALRVTDGMSAREAERELWDSLTSASDGFVDKLFNRRCGRPLSKLLIHTPVSPNMVSIASILIGVASAFFFARGGQVAILIGAILFQLSAIVDCVDGDIARVVFKESPLGRWIDLVGDQIVHISVFVGIAFGVAAVSPGPEIFWLGWSAVAGALISFGVVVRGMRSRPPENGVLHRLIDAATNRDFSVIVLLLACMEQLKIFLWLAAIGSHVFWVTALGLQIACARPAPERPVHS